MPKNEKNDKPKKNGTKSVQLPGAKKPSGPKGKKPAGPPGAKKPAGPGGKLPPGFSKRKEKKKSGVEVSKEGSEYLQAGVQEKLDADTDHFAPDQKEVVKHHGLYQQDDRDLRKELDDKHYYFFIRSKIPGGHLTGEQYLVHDRLADEHGNGTIRITTRQGIQIHGVVQDDLAGHIRTLNEALVTTLGACGDVVRNTMCCPAPTKDPLRQEIQDFARKVSDYTMPQSPAYHDIWLKGYDQAAQTVETIQKVYDGKEEVDPVEPLYGKAYLPRKFKIGFAYPGDNCIDVYTQDVGFIAIADGDELKGFNVIVGGGLGNTHNKPSTFPRLGDLLGYIPKEEAIDVVHHAISIQRENGNRKDRKQARMKYLIEDWGLERFHNELADRLGHHLDEPADMPELELNLHEGWHDQGDGHHYLGLSIENGRIKDDGEMRLKSGLRAVVEQFDPDVHLTPNHDVLLANLHEEDRLAVEALLKEYDVPLPEELTETQKYSMACPALPTCGLALTESERVFPALIDRIEGELARLGLNDEKLSIRMTGCPNGCARPYVSDLGIVGQSLDKYEIYVGGRTNGSRLNEPYKELVSTDEIVSTVRPLFAYFKQDSNPDESFGDFCHRVGVDELESFADSYEAHETVS